MPTSTFAKGLATVMCGAWLWASGMQPGDAAEQVQTISLRGGELRLVNNDERKPKAVINGKEFLFLPDYIGHKATFQLSDRDIVILISDTGRFGGLEYRVFSIRTNGVVQEIDDLDFRRRNDTNFIATKKEDAVHFDLGYYRGLKIDAVLSPRGLDVTRRAVARPAFGQKDCK